MQPSNVSTMDINMQPPDISTKDIDMQPTNISTMNFFKISDQNLWIFSKNSFGNELHAPFYPILIWVNSRNVRYRLSEDFLSKGQES